MSLEELNQGAGHVLSFHKDHRHGTVLLAGAAAVMFPGFPAPPPQPSSAWQSSVWYFLVTGGAFYTNLSSKKRKKEATVEKDVQAFLVTLSNTASRYWQIKIGYKFFATSFHKGRVSVFLPLEYETAPRLLDQQNIAAEVLSWFPGPGLRECQFPFPVS